MGNKSLPPDSPRLRHLADGPASLNRVLVLLVLSMSLTLLHLAPYTFWHHHFEGSTTYYVRPFRPDRLMFLFAPAYLYFAPKAFPSFFGTTSEPTSFIRVSHPDDALIHLTLTRLTHWICSNVLAIDLLWAWFWSLSYLWKHADPPYEPGNFLNELRYSPFVLLSVICTGWFLAMVYGWAMMLLVHIPQQFDGASNVIGKAYKAMEDKSQRACTASDDDDDSNFDGRFTPQSTSTSSSSQSQNRGQTRKRISGGDIKCFCDCHVNRQNLPSSPIIWCKVLNEHLQPPKCVVRRLIIIEEWLDRMLDLSMPKPKTPQWRHYENTGQYVYYQADNKAFNKSLTKLSDEAVKRRWTLINGVWRSSSGQPPVILDPRTRFP